MAEVQQASSLASRHYVLPHNALLQRPPIASGVAELEREHLHRALNRTLDRIDVLEGHTGCVNALSWAQDGNLLISGGDDTTVRLWQVDTTQTERDYPLTCSVVINTGHRGNIFNAKMLPYSSRIVTAARDAQIRVFDLRTALASATPGKPEIYSPDQLRITALSCHQDCVKRIITEESSDIFLSVSEDGTVRQHDLRTSHRCQSERCPPPLVDLGHELYTISSSLLIPYQFVVAGAAPHAYLFDRRHLRSTLENAWGMVPNAGEGLTTCVRRFGRPPRASDGRRRMRDHITSAHMSDSNGHELLLSYSGDGVYLYSTTDDPDNNGSLSKSQTSSSNIPNGSTNAPAAESRSIVNLDNMTSPAYQEQHPNVAIVLPRRRFAGARNVATIKDVNFLGPNDDWVVSGSDDGNFFVWSKDNGNLHGIYEGDSSVVNVVEGHPHLPLVAVSGIDETIKIFSPASSHSSFSRTANAQEIMEDNERHGRDGPGRILITDHLAGLRFLATVRRALDNEVEMLPAECPTQ